MKIDNTSSTQTLQVNVGGEDPKTVSPGSYLELTDEQAAKGVSIQVVS